MKNNRKILQWLADSADLGAEPIPGQSLVEILGDQRVLIENHCGIREYSDTSICVQLKIGVIVICGSGLLLTQMTREQLIIQGAIQNISICRRR